MAQCSAKSKRSGARCKRRTGGGAPVCHMHGGAAPVGIAAARTTHGRYSKHLPERLLARFHEAKSDPALLALVEEISLVDARISDVLSRVDTGESGRQWRAARAAMKGYRTALADGDSERSQLHLDALGAAIVAGTADYRAWEAVGRLVEQRRRLVESERKHMVEQQQTITVERAMLLVSALTDSVRRHVTDRDTLRLISSDIAGLLARADRRPPAADD